MASFSQTHRIRYDVIRNAAGVSAGSGKNHWDYVDPRIVDKLSGVIGKAGVNLTDYAAFCAPDFSANKEITVRSTPVQNFDRIYFIHRDILDHVPNIQDKHILDRFTEQ